MTAVWGKRKDRMIPREERKREGEELERVGPLEFVRVHTISSSFPTFFLSSSHKFTVLLCLGQIDAIGVF